MSVSEITARRVGDKGTAGMGGGRWAAGGVQGEPWWERVGDKGSGGGLTFSDSVPFLISGDFGLKNKQLLFDSVCPYFLIKALQVLYLEL